MAKVSSEPPDRKPNRIEKKNYSFNGAYFLTVCTKERHCLLGQIHDGAMALTEIGAFAAGELSKLENIYPSIILDSFVVMPNHVHLVVMLLSERHNPSVQRIMQQWKGVVSKKAGFPLWQDRFYDRIIYSVAAYRKIRQYIANNPARWKEDCFYEPEAPLAQSL